VLATVLLMIRRGRRGPAFAVLLGSLLLAIAVMVGGPVVAPAQYGYFANRLSGIAQPQDVLKDPNVAYRQNLSAEALKAGAMVDPVFGAGLFDASPNGDAARYRTYDSDWVRIAYRTGPAGVFVFAAPLVLALWWGVSGFLRRSASESASSLLLAGVLMTACSLILRFSGLTYFWWPSLSLFPLVLIARATGVPVGAAAASVSRAAPATDLRARSGGTL